MIGWSIVGSFCNAGRPGDRSDEILNSLVFFYIWAVDRQSGLAPLSALCSVFSRSTDFFSWISRSTGRSSETCVLTWFSAFLHQYSSLLIDNCICIVFAYNLFGSMKKMMEAVFPPWVMVMVTVVSLPFYVGTRNSSLFCTAYFLYIFPK